MLNLLHSSTNQELFEKQLCILGSHYKNANDFCYTKEAIMCNTKSTLFTFSKDEWDTKEDTSKSMKNALHILQYAKDTSWAEEMSNSEKSSP